MSTYETWSIVTNMLIFLAAGAAAIIYYRQLCNMQKQLNTSLEASIRMAHLDLLKIAMSNDDTLAVWQPEIAPSDPARARQHMFVNLHLSHLETLFRLEKLTKDQVRKSLEIRKDNQAYKDFWAIAGTIRAESLDAKDDYGRSFQKQCETVFGKTTS